MNQPISNTFSTLAEGHEDDVLVVLEGTTPDQICMPGTTELNVHTRISEDLPMDLIIKMDLHKLTPFPMTVPCLNGVGSCEYEVCPMLEEMADTLCPSFPEYQPCSCPLLQGEMELYCLLCSCVSVDTVKDE